MFVEDYKDIIAWQKAHELAKEIYSITSSFPSHEIFGLVSQLRRASVSVSSNIVEGFGRKGKKDSVRFYDIARASLKEVDYQLLLSHELNYLPKEKYDSINEKIIETGKVLTGWMKSHY